MHHRCGRNHVTPWECLVLGHDLFVERVDIGRTVAKGVGHGDTPLEQALKHEPQHPVGQAILSLQPSDQLPEVAARHVLHDDDVPPKVQDPPGSLYAVRRLLVSHQGVCVVVEVVVHFFVFSSSWMPRPYPQA